jgi:hypothetical protein
LRLFFGRLLLIGTENWEGAGFTLLQEEEEEEEEEEQQQQQQQQQQHEHDVCKGNQT